MTTNSTVGPAPSSSGISTNGRPDLAEDPVLADNAGRVAHVDQLDAAIGAWTATRNQESAEADLIMAGVPCGPILTAEGMVKDPHLAARDMLVRHPVRIDDDQLTEVAFPGVVPKLSEQPGQVRTLGRNSASTPTPSSPNSTSTRTPARDCANKE
ncbi:MAG TPA: CoA transferase [Pseudonocardiaceae bacterium]|jgi:crotonobetainyl-CoA:carnitine CoA-transferase CaiB-like acyl-CoA transferase